MESIYEVLIATPPSEPMALKAAVLPMLMRGRRQLIIKETMSELNGINH